jgi:hypothetical protein
MLDKTTMAPDGACQVPVTVCQEHLENAMRKLSIVVLLVTVTVGFMACGSTPAQSYPSFEEFTSNLEHQSGDWGQFFMIKRFDSGEQEKEAFDVLLDSISDAQPVGEIYHWDHTNTSNDIQLSMWPGENQWRIVANIPPDSYSIFLKWSEATYKALLQAAKPSR